MQQQSPSSSSGAVVVTLPRECGIAAPITRGAHYVAHISTLIYTAAVTLDLAALESVMRDAYRKSLHAASPRAFALELQCMSVDAMEFRVVRDVPYSADASVFAVKQKPATSDAGCITRFLTPTQRRQRAGVATMAALGKMPPTRRHTFLSK